MMGVSLCILYFFLLCSCFSGILSDRSLSCPRFYVFVHGVFALASGELTWGFQKHFDKFQPQIQGFDAKAALML